MPYIKQDGVRWSDWDWVTLQGGVVKDILLEKVSFELRPNQMRRREACDLGRERTADAKTEEGNEQQVLCFPLAYSVHKCSFLSLACYTLLEKLLYEAWERNNIEQTRILRLTDYLRHILTLGRRGGWEHEQVLWSQSGDKAKAAETACPLFVATIHYCG